MKKAIRKGERVQLSELGRHMLPRWVGLLGTAAGDFFWRRKMMCVRVVWAGTKTPHTLSHDFVELVDSDDHR